MKIRVLPVSLFAALLVAGCGKKETASSSAASTPAPTTTSSAPAAAPVAAAPSSSATAAASTAPGAATAPAAAKSGEARTVEITGNDQMKFSVTTIEAKAGEQLKVVLKNVGTLPKEAMGHNWVLLKKGSDVMAFANAAVAAKASDYVPENLKGQVVAHTKLLGPKQEDAVTFTVPSEPGDYPFLCSFPAHAVVGMKGVLTVK